MGTAVALHCVHFVVQFTNWSLNIRMLHSMSLDYNECILEQSREKWHCMHFVVQLLFGFCIMCSLLSLDYNECIPTMNSKVEKSGHSAHCVHFVVQFTNWSLSCKEVTRFCILNMMIAQIDHYYADC